MKKALPLLLVAYFLFNCLMANAQCDSLQNTASLKVLSWNIYMLPPFIKNTNKISRALEIGKQLLEKDYDIILLQEAFHGKARRIIDQKLAAKYPYRVGPANRRLGSLKANSGLYILSKHPVVFSSELAFNHKSGIDAFSRKGALLVEIDFYGKQVQIINTHLQNSGGEHIKHKQCNEIFEKLLKPHEKAGVPQIVCGDFNIERSSANYEFMLNSLQVTDEKLTGNLSFSFDRSNNKLADKSTDKNELIDYILTKANGSCMENTHKWILPFKGMWGVASSDLSDHYAIEAGFRIEPGQTFSSSTPVK